MSGGSGTPITQESLFGALNHAVDHVNEVVTASLAAAYDERIRLMSYMEELSTPFVDLSMLLDGLSLEGIRKADGSHAKRAAE